MGGGVHPTQICAGPVAGNSRVCHDKYFRMFYNCSFLIFFLHEMQAEHFW